jgi:hypothetical protein
MAELNPSIDKGYTLAKSAGEERTMSETSGGRTLRWYLSRLASMQPAEVFWRARSAATLPLEWAEWKRPPVEPPPHWTAINHRAYPVRLHQEGAITESLHIFDLDFPVGFDFDWHHDYRNGKQVECIFAGALNIRDTAVVSDIKYVWEPSRFQQFSALAFAANAQDQAGYVQHSVDSWLNANPYLSGVHWTSSLELAERLISWALLYPRIAHFVSRDQTFRERWLGSIYLHLTRISRKLSFYSSANNHLLGELVGLFVGASCFDFWPECEGWGKRSQKLLEREIRIQIGEDGVNREQAMSYHIFTLELLLLAYVIGRNTNRPFSNGYAERLRAMAAFLDVVATSTGDLPWYGDSDDARGFVLSEHESGLQVTMQLAGLLFDEPRWLRFGSTPTAASRALVPDLLSKFGQSNPKTEASHTLFPDAGLACLRSADGNVRLLMDFGPLGFPAPAGHGHADALAIWLAIGGEYFLVDSGTYAYHSHPEWRAYFRSTPAHNTACVDGQDQSKMAGRFLWSEKATARLVRFDESPERATIEAEHDGYMRLPAPVVHRRTVIFDRSNGHVSIEDHFCGSGQHEVELFFHMDGQAEILNVGNGQARVQWHGREIAFSSPEHDAKWEIVRGSENPKLGWRSRRFNQKEPIPTLRIRTEFNGSKTIRTCLRIHK